MKRQILILLTIFAAGLGYAQMTLNDCLIYARDHARGNIINRLENRRATLNKRVTRSALLPYISFSNSTNISFGRNIDPETNTYDNRKTLSMSFGVGISIPLFDGLVSINNLKLARVGELRQLKVSEIEEDQLSLNIIRAFYNIIYCKAMVEQVSAQLERDSTDLAATKKGEELGIKSGADVAELVAIVAADEYELLNQRNNLAKAYLELRGLMGMELDNEPLQLIEDVWSDQYSYNDTHPKIAEAALSLKQSELRLRIAKGEFSPRIALSGGISTSYYKMLNSDIIVPGFKEQWRNNMGQYIGLSISLPIFTGLSTINKLKIARIEVEQSRQRLEQTIYDIEKETAEATLNLESVNEEYIAAQRRLEAEELAYRAIRRKFELGHASPLDLYTSSSKLAVSRANLEGKRIQKIIDTITLAYCQGAELIK